MLLAAACGLCRCGRASLGVEYRRYVGVLRSDWDQLPRFDHAHSRLRDRPALVLSDIACPFELNLPIANPRLWRESRDWWLPSSGAVLVELVERFAGHAPFIWTPRPRAPAGARPRRPADSHLLATARNLGGDVLAHRFGDSGIDTDPYRALHDLVGVFQRGRDAEGRRRALPGPIARELHEGRLSNDVAREQHARLIFRASDAARGSSREKRRVSTNGEQEPEPARI